jgi:hypothetical protein
VRTFKNLARAQIAGRNVGMLKLLFHRETLELLGIHCFGEQASEIVHIGQAIMRQPGAANTLDYFIHTTFNYPTMAEAYRVAALYGRKRAERSVEIQLILNSRPKFATFRMVRIGLVDPCDRDLSACLCRDIRASGPACRARRCPCNLLHSGRP